MDVKHNVYTGRSVKPHQSHVGTPPEHLLGQSVVCGSGQTVKVFHAGLRGCWFDSDWNSCLCLSQSSMDLKLEDSCLVSPSLFTGSQDGGQLPSLSLSLSLRVFFLGLRMEDSCILSLSLSVSLSLPWVLGWRTVALSLSVFSLGLRMDSCLVSQSSLGLRMEDSCFVSVGLSRVSRELRYVGISH